MCYHHPYRKQLCAGTQLGLAKKATTKMYRVNNSNDQLYAEISLVAFHYYVMHLVCIQFQQFIRCIFRSTTFPFNFTVSQLLSCCVVPLFVAYYLQRMGIFRANRHKTHIIRFLICVITQNHHTHTQGIFYIETKVYVVDYKGKLDNNKSLIASGQAFQKAKRKAQEKCCAL